MSDEAIDLAFRTGLPYVGLRDHEHDRELDTIVPPDAARSARAIPLAAADDHVRLAVADPGADLSGLAPHLEGRRVELAVAPREEVEAILGPVTAAPELAPEPLAAEPLLAEPLAVEAPAAGPLLAEPPTAESPTAESLRDGAMREGPPEEPVAEPLAAAEPAPEPLPDEPHTAEPERAPDDPAGEPPSWLEPPRKRSRLRTVGLVLLYLLLLAVIGGAIAAYLLTR